MTFKQLEAIYWVARLGGFSAAAERLHTTQSAISRRIQELEAAFDTPLFDRSQRTARLTEKGEEMFLLAGQMLAQRDAAAEAFSRPGVVQRRIRIGVTELTAMTWLPRLVRLIQAQYPKVVIEPDVDLSLSLRDKLLASEVDLIVVPDAFQDSRFVAQPVGRVASAWMCKPGLMDASRPVALQELAAQRLLVQGDRSGTGIVYGRWFQAQGITLRDTLVSNNMIALIGMTVAGLGVSYLPLHCLSSLIADGSLAVLRVAPVLPEVQYMAMHRDEAGGSLIASVAVLAQSCCDFSRLFQTGEGDAAPGQEDDRAGASERLSS